MHGETVKKIAFTFICAQGYK